MVTPRAHRLSRRSEEDDNQSSADLIMKEVKKTYCLRSELLLSSSDSSGLSGFGSLDLTSVVSEDSNSIITYDDNQSILSDDGTETCYFTDYSNKGDDDSNETSTIASLSMSDDEDDNDEEYSNSSGSGRSAKAEVIVHDPRMQKQIQNKQMQSKQIQNKWYQDKSRVDDILSQRRNKRSNPSISDKGRSSKVAAARAIAVPNEDDPDIYCSLCE